jgi:hypothetical protein
MAVGYHVSKTSGTQAGQPAFGVHVVRQNDDGTTTEMVRIGCADQAEQNRITDQLTNLLLELLPP